MDTFTRLFLWISLNIFVVFFLLPATGQEPNFATTLFVVLGVGFLVNLDRILGD